MLKPAPPDDLGDVPLAAAFGRLCVETIDTKIIKSANNAAAFGRLCVETFLVLRDCTVSEAAAFGRLCVETVILPNTGYYPHRQPPSGGCVLKLL